MTTVSNTVRSAVAALLADAGIQKALAFLEGDQDNRIRELKEMVLLYGTPFTEGELRSPMFKEKLEKLGVTQCRVDADDNAYGVIPGLKSPKVLLEAHLDTVFPKDTPLKVEEKDGKLCCPGISDDTSCLAIVLSVVRAINHAGLKPVYSLLVGGSSGEEGEGDLRGAKAFLRDNPDLVAYLPMEPGAPGLITKGAVGSKRYEFAFSGPGGHSWSAYGLPSPIHAMARAMAKMSNVTTPENPRTTYTIGIVNGGTSVNSIAHSASCKLDMRSISAEALAEVERTMLSFVQESVDEENAFRAASGQKVEVKTTLLGDRPAGDQPDGALIVQSACAVFEALGVTPNVGPARSTNANVPISQKVPSVVVRSGCLSGGHHSLNEWLDPKNAHIGAQAALLMLFLLAGLQGVSEPLALR